MLRRSHPGITSGSSESTTDPWQTVAYTRRPTTITSSEHDHARFLALCKPPAAPAGRESAARQRRGKHACSTRCMNVAAPVCGDRSAREGARIARAQSKFIRGQSDFEADSPGSNSIGEDQKPHIQRSVWTAVIFGTAIQLEKFYCVPETPLMSAVLGNLSAVAGKEFREWRRLA